MSGEPIRDDNAIPLTPGQEAIWCEACELWWPCECEETAVDAHATIETVGADGRPVDEGEDTAHDGAKLMTDGSGEVPDHIYVVRAPHRSWWTAHYDVAYQLAAGHRLGDADDYGDEGSADLPGEDTISIMHTRGTEYVLDLASEYPTDACVNYRYDCGHLAYGPTTKLPSTCPECQPVATDGSGESTEGTNQCPKCGTEMYNPTRAPGMLWCDTCELQYWQEGDNWFCCDVDGEPRRVDAATDPEGGAADGE